MLCQATALWSGLLGKFCKVSVKRREPGSQWYGLLRKDGEGQR